MGKIANGFFTAEETSTYTVNTTVDDIKCWDRYLYDIITDAVLGDGIVLTDEDIDTERFDELLSNSEPISNCDYEHGQIRVMAYQGETFVYTHYYGGAPKSVIVHP